MENKVEAVKECLETIEKFKSGSLTKRLSRIEKEIVGFDDQKIQNFCKNIEVSTRLLESAALIKRLSAEIDVVIHSSGILLSLAGILNDGEVVESASLGAGNTGKKFDLETNHRNAEYKFINWKGGSESIRQNGLFKDFYELAEFETEKIKYLYVLGATHPLKFLNGGRALTSVLSKDPLRLKAIHDKYGADVRQVRDYYDLKKDDVIICDVTPFLV